MRQQTGNLTKRCNGGWVIIIKFLRVIKDCWWRLYSGAASSHETGRVLGGHVSMREITYIGRHTNPGKLVAFCLSDLLTCGLSMGIALLLSALLDTTSAAVVSGSLSPVIDLTIIACLYSLALGAVSILSGNLRASIVRDVMLGLRRDAARGLLSIGPEEGSYGSAEQLTVLGQNMDTLEADWLGGTFDILDSIFKIVIGCALLVYLNPLVAIVSLVGMSLPTLTPRLFGKTLAKQQQQVIQDTTTYNGRVRDSAQGGEVIRAFHAEDATFDKLSMAATALQNGKMALARTMTLVTGTSSVVGVVMQFAIMGVTGVFAILGFVSVGSVVVVTQLSGSVISPATELSTKWGKLSATRPILDKVGNIEETSRGVQGKRARKVTQSLELDKVCFTYANAEKPTVLDCLALFEAGHKYAIIGKSGCGKSTMLGLASGLLQPVSGRVLVDGHADCIPDAAFIHQDVFLFDDTLRENVTLGHAFSDDQISGVLQLAKLGDVMEGLPQGLDTPVGEGGSRLSGGERQRVAIARALLHGKTTLFVDEATSALDHRTADAVEDALLALEGVTVIAVTHHLDTSRVSIYDKVFEMREGRLLA